MNSLIKSRNALSSRKYETQPVQDASKAQVCGNPWWTCWSQPAENDCDKSEQGDWNLVTFHQFNADDR